MKKKRVFNSTIQSFFDIKKDQNVDITSHTCWILKNKKKKKVIFVCQFWFTIRLSIWYTLKKKHSKHSVEILIKLNLP